MNQEFSKSRRQREGQTVLPTSHTKLDAIDTKRIIFLSLPFANMKRCKKFPSSFPPLPLPRRVRLFITCLFYDGGIAEEGRGGDDFHRRCHFPVQKNFPTIIVKYNLRLITARGGGTKNSLKMLLALPLIVTNIHKHG